MTSEAWARLADEPENREAAQMLADALQSDGSPVERALGELIALALELQRDPRRRRQLLRDSAALRETHGAALVGPLATLPPLERDVPSPRASLEWGPLGVRALTLQQDLRAGETGDLARVLDEALGFPALRLLERLTIKLILVGGPLAAHDEVIGVIARRAPPSLRELVLEELGDPWGERVEDPPCRLSPLSSLSRLRALSVRGREVLPDGLAIPSLRALRVDGGLSPEALAALATARWPALESLHLGFDSERDAPLGPIRALLDGQRAPRLREFSLDTYGPERHGPSLVAAIAKTPQLPRLTELAFDRVDDATAGALLARRAAFAHLTRLGAGRVERRPVRLKGLCRHVDCDEHRLEREADGRFAEIEIDEPRVRVREGCIGQPGRLRIVDGGWARYHAEIAARHLDGYRTVRGTPYGRGDEVPNDELWRAIVARPDDPSPYLAYASWIRMWGAPRAELIALQCARAATPDDARLARREAELFTDDKSAEILLGELRPHVAGQASPTVALGWRFGFVRTARLTAMVGDADVDAAAEVATLLLEHPSGRLVEEIVLGGLTPDATSRAQAAIRSRRGRRLRVTLAARAP